MRAQSSAHRENAGWLWFAAAIMGLWLGILAHEAAHFSAASLLQFRQHVATGTWTTREQLTVVGAGPVMTIAVLLSCSLAATRRDDSRWKLPWVAVALGAASRTLVIAPGILLGHGLNDEITVSHILGIPARVLWTGEMLLVAAIVWLCVERAVLPAVRFAPGYAVAGFGIGWLSLFTVGRAIGLPI